MKKRKGKREAGRGEDRRVRYRGEDGVVVVSGGEKERGMVEERVADDAGR